MNLKKLRDLAEAAAFIDHNETAHWYRYDDLIRDVIFYPKNARFIAACSPHRLITLLDLIEQQNHVIGAIVKYPEQYLIHIAASRALAAYDKLNQEDV